MPRKKSKSAASAPAPSQVDDQKRELAAAIAKADKLGESELEVALLFLSNGKPEIARRRLQFVIEQYGQSRFADEARQLMSTIGASLEQKSKAGLAIVGARL